MARIAIVGVGAIGGAVAGLLAMAGAHEIILCTRRPLGQLTVTMPTGPVHVEARNVTLPDAAGPVDWVMVATKAYDTEGAAKWLPALCADGAPVAVLQNGVEHRERFAPYVDTARLVPVIVECPAERREDGEVRVRGPARMRVEDKPLGRGFAGLFAGSSATIEREADFVTAAWRKLCLNSIGALNALTLKPAGVLRGEAMGRLALAVVAECVAVGRDAGGSNQRHPADYLSRGPEAIASSACGNSGIRRRNGPPAAALPRGCAPRAVSAGVR